MTRDELETGKDYGFVFGLRKERGQHMIYNGGDSWTAINGGKSQTSESAGTTAKALDYVGKPTVWMGRM